MPQQQPSIDEYTITEYTGIQQAVQLHQLFACADLSIADPKAFGSKCFGSWTNMNTNFNCVLFDYFLL